MTARQKVQQIAKLLVLRGQTLGLAESCTGGRLGATVTSVPGASKYFLGGLVSYANEVKHDLLRVPLKDLQTFGAVSKPVALKMARGAVKIFGSDWAVAITGIAGPDGGSKRKPVGLVFFAVVGPKVEVVGEKVFKGNRNQIQQRAVEESISLLLKKLKGDRFYGHNSQ